MKLVGIELWRVDLALSNPVATSQAPMARGRFSTCGS